MNKSFLQQHRKEGWYLLLSTGVALLSFLIAPRVSHVAFWIWVTSGLIASVFGLGNLLYVFFRGVPRKVFFQIFQNAALVILGIMIVVMSAEAYLGYRDTSAAFRNKDIQTGTLDGKVGAAASEMGMPLSPQAKANIRERQKRVTLPLKWEQKKVKISGAHRANTWLGVLQVFDENHFRRITPFPEKQAKVFRVLVVGDSLTYGQGVDEQLIYSSLLQRELEKRFDIEILNLGVLGRQSEDILRAVQEFVPQLQPDLVVYGICQNDFLPSEVRQYGDRGFDFPFPDSFEQFMLNKSRFARFVNDLFDQTLRAIGLRVDFFDDIMTDFDGYQQRFRRDVAQMNRFVMKHKLPPIVGMVLDQYPAKEGRGHQITKVAERYMREAGFEVIDTEEYYRRFNGRNFGLKWDGHPNEEAHAIFAAMIKSKLEHHPALQPYRKS